MGTSCCCDKRTKEKGDLEFRNPPALMSDRLNSTEYDRHNAAKKIQVEYRAYSARKNGCPNEDDLFSQYSHRLSQLNIVTQVSIYIYIIRTNTMHWDLLIMLSTKLHKIETNLN